MHRPTFTPIAPPPSTSSSQTPRSYRSLWFDGQSPCSPGPSGEKHAQLIRLILRNRLIDVNGGVLIITFCTRFSDWANPDKTTTGICISEMYRIFDEEMANQKGAQRYRVQHGNGLQIYKQSKRHAQMGTCWWHLKLETVQSDSSEVDKSSEMVDAQRSC